MGLNASFLNVAFLTPLLANRPLLSAVLAWAMAQVLKLILFSILERRFYWRRLIDTGGQLSATHDQTDRLWERLRGASPLGRQPRED